MKNLLLALALVSSVNVYAHDDHGPKIKEGGKYGGVVAAVVEEGKSKTVAYKTELVKNEDGTIKVYFFDTASKLVDMNSMPAKVNAFLEYKINGKYEKEPFGLAKDGAYFSGKMPKPKRRPFNIDIQFEAKGKKLIAGFENLD